MKFIQDIDDFVIFLSVMFLVLAILGALVFSGYKELKEQEIFRECVLKHEPISCEEIR